MTALVLIRGGGAHGHGQDDHGREEPPPAVPSGANVTHSPRGANLTQPRPLAGLRLTHRGRLVVLTLSMVLAAGVGFAGGRADAAPVPGATAGVVVQSGDTLWALAHDVATPGEDVRDVVLEIQRLNGMATADLVAGQVIRLPAD